MIVTTKVEIQNILKQLGVASGDILMLHSSTYSLGQIEGGMGGLLNAIIDYLGEDGGLIVPTFSYSFRRNQVFDVMNTIASKDMGSFSEFVRNSDASFRSSDPLFSIAAIGERIRPLLQRTSKNCFGEGSIYNELFNQDIKFMGMGISYSTGMSGFMNIERLAEVPYRFEKTFYGQIIMSDKSTVDDHAIHYIRDEENFDFSKMNREEMGLKLEKKGIAKNLSYGYGKHFCLEGKNWRDFVFEELLKNPFCMLQK